MGMRQVDHRGTDLHLRGDAQQRCDEHQAVGNVLGRVGEVLAAIAFGVSEPVGENEGFAILLERLDVASCRRMDRHREIAELHACLQPNPGPIKELFWRVAQETNSAYHLAGACPGKVGTGFPSGTCANQRSSSASYSTQTGCAREG